MAADRRATASDMIVGEMQKIWKVRGVLVGGSGHVGLINRFLQWVRQGCVGDCPAMYQKGDEDTRYTATGVIILPAGYGLTFVPSGLQTERGPYFSYGSGCDLALGAMAHGATAVEAVVAACKHDINSGNGIDVLSFD